MPTLWRLLVPVFMAVTLVLAAGCETAGSGSRIDLSAPPPPDNPAAFTGDTGETLVLAVAAVNSPRSTFAAYEDFASYLGRRLGMRARLVGSKTYSEINSLVQSGDATLAMVCSAAYVYGHSEFGMEALVIPVVDGKTTYHSYLIVADNSPIRNWKELWGRTFAFTDPMSNTGRLVALDQLRRIGETPESFFARHIFTYSHDNSIKSVAWGVVDAAVVDSLVYDYALARGEDDAAKTRKIWQSSPYGINPITVHPNLDGQLKARLRAELQQMHETDEGRQILSRLGFDRFVPAQDNAYDSIREMIRATEFQERR